MSMSYPLVKWERQYADKCRCLPEQAEKSRIKMTEPTNAPVFAGRYRFEPVGDDWDTGRSGFTHLVRDLKNETTGGD